MRGESLIDYRPWLWAGGAVLSILVERVLQRERVGPEEAGLNLGTDRVVLADPELLARALGNLVRNARRYAGAAGPFTVSVRSMSDSVLLRVMDEGPGVPSEALPRLGEPLCRQDPARTREDGGAGLGLAIVKGCVAACRGSLVLQNRVSPGVPG